MADPDVVVLERGSDDPDLVARVHDEVLVPSFTEEERPPREAFLHDLGESTLAVAGAGGDVLGAGVTDSGTQAPLALLSYLAVRSDLRSGGVGSLLLATLRRHWADTGPAVVIGEVHDPRCWEDGPDERPASRLRFYERNGARLLAAPWVQPSLGPGKARVPGMLLLIMGGQAEAEPVPSAWLEAWMVDYFTWAEGEQALGDATLAALLSRARSQDPIPVGPIAAHRDQPLLDVG